MLESFQTLPSLLQAYWIVALAASLIFIIQTVMMFFGADADGDVSTADVDGMAGDVPGLFTFKNLVGFALGFGWSGVCFYDRIDSLFWLNVLNVVIGLVFVLVFFLIISQLMRLGKDASFHVQDAVGLTADVYLRIPSAGQGVGKVQVSVKGTVHELDALTDGEGLPTGAKARIVAVVNTSTIKVETC